ncbi:3-oxoacyl-[acyl-carrier-protein] synthase III C-terminal domain-containing protein [Streptomyces sp. NPDC058665]|uniref:3-oxoacyl-[acyl-carrier-protein] synthase III C-terminal domain-containing protein n=1 Tax=Streptomyces sp. NPDC058665 TaxID=3346586 RepID=UPI00364F46C9
MENEPKLPVVIVSGLHRDARREVVEELLKGTPHSVALHHDLTTAGAGTVRRTVRNASGDTAAASIPVALTQARDTGVYQPGSKVLLTAFGGGATWGVTAMTWPELATPEQ